MSNYIKIANKKDVLEGMGATVEAQGKSIALFNVGGTFHAIDNTCAHRGGPLGEGGLDGKEVTCPWHGWQYDVTTGQCTTDPSVCQKTFPVKVEGDDILVDLT